jgi:hypothetical protein
MAFGFFTVPIQDGGRSQEEWNAFLRRHKILSVDRRRVEQGASSFWSFCIDYLESDPAGASGYRAATFAPSDYRRVLTVLAPEKRRRRQASANASSASRVHIYSHTKAMSASAFASSSAGDSYPAA